MPEGSFNRRSSRATALPSPQGRGNLLLLLCIVAWKRGSAGGRDISLNLLRNRKNKTVWIKRVEFVHLTLLSYYRTHKRNTWNGHDVITLTLLVGWWVGCCDGFGGSLSGDGGSAVSRSISGLLGVGYTDSWLPVELEGGFDADTSFNAMLNMGIQKSLSLDSAWRRSCCKPFVVDSPVGVYSARPPPLPPTCIRRLSLMLSSLDVSNKKWQSSWGRWKARSHCPCLLSSTCTTDRPTDTHERAKL